MPQPPVRFADLPASTTVEIVAADTTAEFDRVAHDAITRRAYQLFEESGKLAGRDDENWRQAESETLRNGLEIREMGAWISVDGELSVSSEIARIVVSPRRVVIDPGVHDVFFTADLSMDIEPKTAIASLKNGRLKLMVKKGHTNSHRM